MKLNCCIRNIPNTASKNLTANGLRAKGVTSRKRGRGARALPYAHIPADQLSSPRQGGEYQDLPMEKAARFNMYFNPTVFDGYARMLHFDYVGVTPEGKMIVRKTKKLMTKAPDSVETQRRTVAYFAEAQRCNRLQ